MAGLAEAYLLQEVGGQPAASSSLSQSRGHGWEVAATKSTADAGSAVRRDFSGE